MKWNEAPQLYLKGESPSDFPVESPEERKKRSIVAREVMQSEVATASPEQAPILQNEIARETARIGESIPTAPVLPEPAKVLTWDQAPEEKEETWKSAPEVKDESSWWDTISAVPGVTAGGVRRGVGGVIKKVGETPPFLELQAEAFKRGVPVSVIEEEYKAKPPTNIAEFGDVMAEQGKEQIEEATPSNLSYWKKIALSAVSSTAQQVPGLAASIASRSSAPALSSAGALTGGSSYAEARDKGFSPERSTEIAAVDTGAEVILERLPLKFMLDNIGGPVLKLIAGTLVREVPTEMATTAIQNVNAKLSTRPEMTWEEYGQELLDTAATVAISAPLTAGIGRGISKVAGVPASAQAEPVDEQEEKAQGVPAAVAAPVEGENNVPLSDPNIDISTVEVERPQIDTLVAQAEAIDPETLTAEDAEKGKAAVELQLKKEKAPALPQAELAWAQVSTAPASAVADIGELGATAKQAANAVNYINPNTAERLDRQFLYGPEGYEGLTPRQVLPKPGTYTLGQPSDDRPAEYLKAVHDTYEQWRAQYMPDATIVLSNEQLFSNSALGWHYSTGPKDHMIVPAVLRLKGKGLGQMNPNSQASAFYNASHEFGHALVMHSFFENVDDATAIAIRDESRKGVVATQAPATQQAVIAEFNSLKQGILDDSITAKEFVSSWLAPSKIGRKNFLKDLKVAPEAPASQLVNAIVERAVIESNIADEIGAEALRKQLREDFTSLDEYLAEQVSRHAYQRKWDKASPLGQYFSNVLTKLREFFVGNKADQTIAAGVSFQEWIDGLSKMPRLADEKVARVENKVKSGKKKAKAEAAAVIDKVKKNVKKPVARVGHNVKTDTSQPKEVKARAMVTALVRAKVLEVNDEQYKEMLSFVKLQNWEEFMDLYQSVSGKTVKFELDTVPVAKVEDAKDWKDGKVSSPSFKAWFGDWELDAAKASKVRIGAVHVEADGTIKLDTENAGPPLVTFMSLAKLKAGVDLRSSTVRGANFSEAMDPSITEGEGLVPVLLNIRNPLILNGEQTEAPPATELEAQGYDGVLYQNQLEGDIAWVALKPEQVKLAPRAPYSGKLHMELDYDQSTPEGSNLTQLYRGVKPFLKTPKPLRMALRAVQGLTYHVLQLQHLAHIRPELTDLAFFSQANTHYNLYKNGRQAGANKIAKEWEKLNRKDRAFIDKAILTEYEGKEHWFQLKRAQKERDGKVVPWWDFQVTQKTLDKYKEAGVDPDSARGKRLMKLHLDVKNDLMDKLNEDEKIMVLLAAKRFGSTPAAFNSAVQSISYQVHQLRLAPFFPQGRFGRNMLIIKRKKVGEAGYEVVWKEAFEDPDKWAEASRKAMANKKADEKVEKYTLSDKEYVLMSLPLDFLENAASELDLKDDQRDRLMEILSPAKTQRILSQYDQSRLGIKGYTTDAARAYASFSWHHANLQAKMLYRSDFNLAIGSMNSKVKVASKAADPNVVRDLEQVLKFMQRARDYIMNPPSEWQTVRAIVSISYLMLNIKTALLNFFGLATTWVVFQQRYGIVKGNTRLAKAMWRAGAATVSDKQLPPDIQKGLDRALKEGVLAQDYAYHLAAMSNRSPIAGGLNRYTQSFVDYAMFPFRMVELSTRRISFLAELESALEKPQAGTEEAYQEAVRRTNLTQNDYSGGNRVPFMRGTQGPLGGAIPMATIFASFTQHMAFHAFGGYEIGERRMAALVAKETGAENIGPKWYNTSTGRLWLVFLLLGGYEGLPGAENLIDLIEFFWRKSGHPKPIRQELREFIQSVDQDPHLWSRGLMHNVAGMNLSRSVAMGKILPGTDLLAHNAQNSTAESIGNAAVALTGPTGSFIKFALGVAFEPDLNKALRKMPGGLGNIYNAYDWSENGITGPNGGLILQDQAGNPRAPTSTEIAMKFFGFQPTSVTEAREKLFEQHDRKMFWQTQRSDLMRQLKSATLKDDDEAIDKARERISTYNERLLDMEDEYSKMRITGADIRAARSSWRKGKRADEEGRLPGRRYREVGEGVRRSFDRPGEAGPAE